MGNRPTSNDRGNDMGSLQQVASPASSWVVQKFGGTSIGKFAEDIVENVVK